MRTRQLNPQDEALQQNNAGIHSWEVRRAAPRERRTKPPNQTFGSVIVKNPKS
jgi:hypothetical protein